MTIVRHDLDRCAESGDDIPPYGPLALLGSDGGQWFGLDPFSEIVDRYNDKFAPSGCHRELSDNVNPPPGKGNYIYHWVVVGGWPSWFLCKLLANPTRANSILAAERHAWPIISH